MIENDTIERKLGWKIQILEGLREWINYFQRAYALINCCKILASVDQILFHFFHHENASRYLSYAAFTW